MTEVEFSSLLSELAATAKALNEKSDSVNALIKRFQDALRSMNLGLEVWPVTLDSTGWTEEDERDGSDFERGTIDTELGFTRYNGEWVLATRAARWATYDSRGILLQPVGEPRFYSADEIKPLLEESRGTRIEALAHFPKIAEELKAAAAEAIETIEAAQQYVK